MTDSARDDQKRIAGGPLFYVGLGASAGGLEALEAFFGQTSDVGGMAFIVIQHLSPDYKSMMVELLSKHTAMPVRRAEEGMVVDADTVYLIPPRKNLSIFHGKLLLTDQDHTKGINLPIDIFLRSLAEDQGEKAIAVILSGTGSDGVRGVRAIKEAGGMVMVQTEDTARFDGMPRAAISTGLADFVLAPEEMPAKLLSFARHPYAAKPNLPEALLSDEDGLTRIFSMLRERTRVDFTFYKPSTVVRRIERRMTVTQVEDLRDYVRFLEAHSGEVITLYKELLIGVTSFFRDREVFDTLAGVYLPRLFETALKPELRFWVAGCSTGEEAYSLAILSRELLERSKRDIDVKIFATDIDRDAIARASNGCYPDSIAADVSTTMLSRYFNRKGDTFHVDRSIREMVVFAQHNLIKDPPFTNIDLISCRNLLIYLQPVLQRTVMDLFCFSMNPESLLLLGTSETVGDMTDCFEMVHPKYKIYKAKGIRPSLVPVHDVSGAPGLRLPKYRRPHGMSSRQFRAHEEERLLDRFLQGLAGVYVPLSIVVNEQMEVQHVLGDTEGYFRLPSGKLMNDVTKLAVQDLAIPLATGLQKVFKSGEELKYTNIRLHIGNDLKVVQLRIRLLPGRKTQEQFAAVFLEEMTPQGREMKTGDVQVYDHGVESEQRIEDLEQELQFTRENLQATVEELETSNEELQATNEELLASNEELQSTNEELQSVNEELHTVNAEYQRKIIELTEANNDLENLITGTQVATLFLDENLEVRKFTPELRRIFRVQESDLKRSIQDISHSLLHVDPIEIIRRVQGRSLDEEHEVCSQEGSHFLMRVLPYQIATQAYSGVVLTFVDITKRKQGEDHIRRLATVVRDSNDAISLLDFSGKILTWNHAAERMYGWTEAEALEMNLSGTLPLQEYEQLQSRFEDLLNGREVAPFETRRCTKGGQVRDVLLTLTAILDQQGAPTHVATIERDITEQKRAVEALRESEERYRRLFETMAEGVVYQDRDGRVLSANPAAERMLKLAWDDLSLRASIDAGWKTVRRDGSDLLPEEHPSMVALKTGEAVTGVVIGSHHAPTGKTRWLRVNAIPIRKESDEEPSRVCTTIDDITEKVESVRELKKRERLLRESERFARGILDALTSHIAVLDGKGVIIAVNRAWRDFARMNSGIPESLSEGVNYLDVCDSVNGEEAGEAAAFVAGIRSVMKGELPEYAMEYACHSPEERRWFIGRVSPCRSEDGLRIVVAHENITIRMQEKVN